MTTTETAVIDDLVQSEAENHDDYLNHLGWDENPFSRSPTPSEYVPVEHDHLADVIAALNTGSGPIVAHGDYNRVGKTTFLRQTLRAYNSRKETHYIPLRNTLGYSPTQILADRLGINPEQSQSAVRAEIRNHVEHGDGLLVGFDDVPFRNPNTISDINALIDIPELTLILTGETEEFRSDEFRELHRFRTTVAYQYELKPTDLTQTRRLIQTRIQTAKQGAEAQNPFTEDAIRVLHDKSGGRHGVIVKACSELVSLGAYQFSKGRGEDIDGLLARAIDYPEKQATTETR